MNQSQIMIFNVKQILRATAFDLSFSKEMTVDLINEIPNYLSRIESAIETGTCEELQNAAHTFMGAAGNLGADRIRDQARKLEKEHAFGNETIAKN